MLQEFGQLDILVSNAAVNPTAGPLVDTPAGAWLLLFTCWVLAAAPFTDIKPHLPCFSLCAPLQYVRCVALFELEHSRASAVLCVCSAACRMALAPVAAMHCCCRPR
jgi:NAD(P)-dependent dehydrogenase (short-subunit alcohol dehydrogenase family)